MKNIFTLTTLLFALAGKAQMQPADSLTGTYAGKSWYANPATNPWVITNDTFFVQSIDSVNCMAGILFRGGLYNWQYYSDYYSCNSTAPTNYYMKFYNLDSIRSIDNNAPQAPPNPPLSERFYGKRISHYTSTIGINEIKKKDELSVYPNPAKDMLNVECLMVNGNTNSYKITNTLGELILQGSAPQSVNISALPNDIYFLEIKSEKESFIKKIIITR